MKIVFLGTPEFAVKSLKALNDAFKVSAAFTQTDKKKDRGQKLTFSPVKKYCIENGIEVYQFSSISSSEAVAVLKELSPDLMVTAAFGQILSGEGLSIPKYGCINVHASLLPKYRGAAPIERALMEGEKETGVTTMMTDIGMDTGDMLLSKKVNIKKEDTGEELRERLSDVGASLIVETVKKLVSNDLRAVSQDSSLATYAPKISKEDLIVNFKNTTEQVLNKIRALSPNAKTGINGKSFKIIKAHKAPGAGAPGEVLAVDKMSGVIVATGDGAISVDLLQFEGKGVISALDAVNANRFKVGDIVG